MTIMIYDSNFDKLLDMFDNNRFQVVIYVSKLARKLSQDVYNIIRGSESLSWAISGITPENLERRIHKYLNNTQIDDMISYKLELVSNESVKDAVFETIHESLKSKHLIYVYKDIEDPHLKSRVRILSNIIWEYILTNKD